MELVKIIIFPHDNKKGELINFCRMITGQTRKEPGCRHCSILHDTDSDNRVGMESHWEHMAFVDDYFRSEHFRALLGAIKMLAIDYGLTINEGSPAEGHLAVNRARRTK